MVYYDYLKPIYTRQQSYYNKAYYQVIDNNATKELTLYSDNIKDGFKTVCKIILDKKHKTKSRYYITNKSNFDKLTYKHVCDFIYQFYEHKTTKKKILQRNKFIKSKLFEFALSLD